MKKISIELSDEQYEKMKAHQKNVVEINAESDSLSGCSIKLCCCELGDWLEIEMNGVLNLGDVNWKIE
ncbi:hypothetical protein [Flavobacterium frigoris]|uniref:Uncharacterized protein n=1 Tax=Flavobacterium frigoris TaxID=229204 RepID=A0A1H9HZH6_FLAFI|nr:hypothetical protein [Flavobacterium frigoris]SEQ67667.1 hypothetical protein SAMN05444355_103308 [Flavobacterium frigoris]